MKAFPYEESYNHRGMDLRDYFAAKAMQGMLADYTNQCNEDETYEEFAKDSAESAYIFADAMMEARNESK